MAGKRRIDLTGQILKGWLVEIPVRVDKHGNTIWKVKCINCGVSHEATASALKKELVRRCGCSIEKEDLTGRRFGFQTVLEFSHKGKTGGDYWLVKCDCGNIRPVQEFSLRRGGSLSCGCGIATRDTREDLIGTIFGKQVVIGFSKKEDNRIWCKVKCECGTEREVREDQLKSGESTSCGCWREEIIPQQKYGRLTALFPLEERNNRQMVWRCLCDCGNIIDVVACSLKSGNTRSCGCLDRERREDFVLSRITHHKARTRIYNILYGILERCYNSRYTHYNNYGGRGITVCDEWRNNHISFFEWAEKSGYADNLTIERINNDGPYSPENCKWATVDEQSRNKRNNIYLTFEGISMVGVDWANLLGISDETIYERYRRGLPVEQILSPFNLTTGKKLKQFIKD